MTYRAIEEFWMLEYSFQDLQWARRKKLITDTGWELIGQQRKMLLKMKKKVAVWEKSLPKKERAEIQKLKAELKSAAKKFKKI